MRYENIDDVMKKGWPRWSALFLRLRNKLKKTIDTCVRLVYLDGHEANEKGALMGKTTVYLNKEAEEYAKRAKEYDENYTASNAVSDGFKAYVHKMDIKTKGMIDYIVLDGEEDQSDGTTFGRRVKFVGKRLSSIVINIGRDETQELILFYTRKGKYLVAIIKQDGPVSKSWFNVYESLKDLHAAGLPPNLLSKAESVPGDLCEELDI